jgi:hypothetical protein
MSGSSRTQSSEKRLLNELKSYQQDPNDALISLGPVSDSDLMNWSAVMKGVPGTAYEGTHATSNQLLYAEIVCKTLNSTNRRRMGPVHKSSTNIPTLPPYDSLHNPNLPSKHPLPHWRNLPRPLEHKLDSRIHDFVHLNRHTPAVDERGTRFTTQCGGCVAHEGGRLDGS